MKTNKRDKDLHKAFGIIQDTIDDYEERGGDPTYVIEAVNMIGRYIDKFIEKEKKQD